MVERIFSASASGRRGRAPSQIDLIEANISPEEIARRRTEQRKRELIDAGRKGFEITMPSDFDWDTFAPWVVRVSDQTVWRREPGSPPDGYLPATHCVLVHDDGSWGYLHRQHSAHCVDAGHQPTDLALSAGLAISHRA
jgi:hypothetical protein